MFQYIIDILFHKPMRLWTFGEAAIAFLVLIIFSCLVYLIVWLIISACIRWKFFKVKKKHTKPRKFVIDLEKGKEMKLSDFEEREANNIKGE